MYFVTIKRNNFFDCIIPSPWSHLLPLVRGACLRHALRVRQERRNKCLYVLIRIVAMRYRRARTLACAEWGL